MKKKKKKMMMTMKLLLLLVQMQGTSRCWWRFNPLLLRLLGEIFLSFLGSHSSWGSALDLAPPLRVGRWRLSVLHSDRTGLKKLLTWELWLTQAGGREGYGVRGEPAAAKANGTLHQPEARRAFSQGSWPWIPGPWQWRAAQAPQKGGMDSDLCLHTGFLVAAAAAALASHAHLWGPRCYPRLAPVSGALLSSALNPLSSRTRKQRGKKKSLASLAGPDFSPDSLLANHVALTPSGCVHAASPLPGLRLKPEPQLPAPLAPAGFLYSYWVFVAVVVHLICPGMRKY
ncbi:uncharacterized protein [Pseudorca crassidens]|uniref:uncharacterized protein n=1 Tax=Pseudorca crassidens TaxID=82174 RepID=UPI00352E417D